MTLRNSQVPVTAATLTGMTQNQVAFGNAAGGLQGSANLTFNGSTLALAGAQSITGQLTSTLAPGTAPFVVASTTVVANLNASLLLGGTWAAPGSIGSGTPGTGAFTTLSATGTSTLAAVNASGAVTITAVGSTINTDASAELLTLNRTSAHGCYFHIKNTTKGYILAVDINNNGGSDFTIFDNTSGATRLQISGTGDTSITGALKLGNAYVATPPTCTGYVTLKDSTGTTYKVLVST